MWMAAAVLPALACALRFLASLALAASSFSCKHVGYSIRAEQHLVRVLGGTNNAEGALPAVACTMRSSHAQIDLPHETHVQGWQAHLGLARGVAQHAGAVGEAPAALDGGLRQLLRCVCSAPRQLQSLQQRCASELLLLRSSFA